MKLTWIVKGHDLAAIILALFEILVDISELIYTFALRVSPIPALSSVAATHIISPLAKRVFQPVFVFVGVGVPCVAADFSEIRGARVPSEVTEHLANGRLP